MEAEIRRLNVLLHNSGRLSAFLVASIEGLDHEALDEVLDAVIAAKLKKKPVSEVFERGLMDGLRLWRGNVSMDELMKEHAERHLSPQEPTEHEQERSGEAT